MKSFRILLLLFYSTFLIFTCSIDYENIDLKEKSKNGKLIENIDLGFKMRIPSNFKKMNGEELIENLKKLDLDSSAISFQASIFPKENKFLEVYVDTIYPANFIAIFRATKYLSLIPKNIYNFNKTQKNSFLNKKEIFPGLEFKKISESEIQIDKPFKYYKSKTMIKLGDWKRFNSTYLKTNTKKMQTIGVIFANMNEDITYDKYVTTTEFLN